jgi:Lrp/AsnC family transcriptional regulator, leucine-responsive regulatory protein
VSSHVRKGLDEVDLQILHVLQTNAQISNAELARQVNLSPPATHTRVKRLENEGYIDRQVVILNQEKLGFNLLCFIFISTNFHQAEKLEVLENAFAAMPEVLECHCLTGEYDYVLKVAIKDRNDLEAFIRKLNSLGITRIQTSLSLREVKYSTALPIMEEEE